MKIVVFRILAVGAAVFAAPVVSAPAYAGTGVSPILLQLSPRARVATVTLSNGDNHAVKLVAEVKERSQSEDQSEILTDSDEVIVNPPIALVPASKAQLFRVALRHPLPPGADRAYRVIITDVTPAAVDTTSTGGKAVASIAVRFSHMIPLYVTTMPGGKPAPSIAPCTTSEAGKLCARVLNTGQVHAKVKAVSFQSGSWHATAQQRGTVLAGGVLRFVVPRPASVKSADPITVSVDIDGQTNPLTATFNGAPN